MTKFDGHTHSSISDGTDTPTELVQAAAAAGLSGLALADHDTFAGWDEAITAAQTHGLQLLPSVELSTSYRGSSAHLLAYLPDRYSPVLVGALEQVRRSRRTRLERLVRNISADYPHVTWEELLASNPSLDVPLGRPHVADLLVRHGIVADRSAAFTRILSPRGPYYVAHWAPHPAQMVQMVRAAGGVPVLAHPLSQHRQRPLPVEVVGEMVDAGLFGLERDHREHDAAARHQVDAWARQFRIRVTGGSDYHGAGKPNRLGENWTGIDVLEAIISEGVTAPA